MTELINVSHSDCVLTLAFNRPDKKNAITDAMYKTLADRLEAAEKDASVRTILIRGEGEHLFRAVDEAIEIGRRAGGPAHVSHLKCETSLVWGRAGFTLIGSGLSWYS